MSGPIDPAHLAEEYDIDHDGWGCFACNENGEISDENPA